MFDKELALSSLDRIRSTIDTIYERAATVKTADDFLLSPEGMLRLDAICMNLIALGESVKGLDKQTGGELLTLYPEIYWSGVMRMRDKIAHHYFDVDVDVVMLTIKEDLPPMSKAIDKIISDLQ